MLGMFNADEIEDLFVEDTTDSTPDVDDSEAVEETEEASPPDDGGVVWVLGPNGKLQRS